MDGPTLGEPSARLVVGLPAREPERVAVGDEPLRDREPDALVRAGDERNRLVRRYPASRR